MASNSTRVLRLDPGTQVLWDGNLYAIESAIAVDRVLLKCVADGNFCTAPIGEIRAITTSFKDSDEEGDIEDIPKAFLDQASSRETVLRQIVLNGTRLNREQMQDLQLKLGLEPSRIYELIRALRLDSRPKTIVSRKRGPKSGGRTLDPKKEAIVDSVIGAHRRSKKPTRINAVHDAILLACAKANVVPPCLDTVTKRVHEQARELTLRTRLGSKRAREAVSPKAGVIRTTAALAMVEIDHSPLDVFLVDSRHRRPIGRAFLTIVVDTHTRVVLGFHVSLEAPSVLTVALAVTHAILAKDLWLAERGLSDVSWPIWGVFEQSRTDNANEFHSDAYAAGCQAWGIRTPTFRDIGQKEQGAIVERVIGTFQRRIERLPGSTGNGVKHRADYNPEHDAQMTLGEVEIWLARHICEVYHVRKHRGIGMTPRMAWEQSHMTPDGLRLPPIVTDRRQLLLDFLPMEKRKVTPTGISFFGDRYWAPVLRSLVGQRERVVIRYDPRNMALIYVRMASGAYIDIPYADQTKPALPLWEIRAMRKELSNAVASQRDVPVELKAAKKQEELLKGAKKKTREALRRQERLDQAMKEVRPTEKKDNGKFSSSPRLDYSQPVEVEDWEGDV
ncbi:Mu transposase C-terminal domain-containing protein [Dyella sp. Tek66A03]|uniref:Mu transposase C-terminal domain-containing protein n=1 Tax=Dyella sp. Tek66A03 TaxID=3458298 RepID=UPI00403EF4BB